MVRAASAVPKQPEAGGHGAAVRQHSSAVAQTPQVLGRIEAIRHAFRESREWPFAKLSSMRLAGVLDERHTCAPSERNEPGQIASLTVEVHRKKRGRISGQAISGVQRVKKEGVGIDVGKKRLTAGRQNRQGGEARGQGSGQYFIAALAEIFGAQRQLDGVSPVSNGNGVPGTHLASELILE